MTIPFPLVAFVASASSDAVTQQTIAELRAEIRQLRDENARSAARIGELEARLPRVPAVTVAATAVPVPAPLASAVPHAQSPVSWDGDLRVRYEMNTGGNLPDRGRASLRARVHASFAPAPWLTVGARLVTGDPDDPNSSDVTVGDYLDDMAVSLDQAYLRASIGKGTILLGKFPQPLFRTELVWDTDVNPQGAAISFDHQLTGSTNARLTAIYMIVDEAAAGPDSDMLGLQGSISFPPIPDVTAELALGYYHYALKSTKGADAGDFRSNRVGPQGYLSRFRLVDAVASVTYGSAGSRWPLRVTGNYVVNTGSTTPDDSGLAMNVAVGRLKLARDWRVTYGYSQAGVDAVLAAFSQDNTDLATNYVQHALTAEMMLRPKLTLAFNAYRFRQRSAAYATAFADWRNRFRLALMAEF